MLTKMNSHLCVPYLESDENDPSSKMVTEQSQLLGTHIPYSYLPDSIKNDCKLGYIIRDPKETLVSQWHFFNKIFKDNQDPLTLERAAEIFYSGEIAFSPYWDHVLEYWEASQRSAEKVMFIKYEDLRHYPKPHVRKLASFLGKPFGDHNDDAQVENVIWRSSFDRLKDLDVNKTGKSYSVVAPLNKNQCMQEYWVFDSYHNKYRLQKIHSNEEASPHSRITQANVSRRLAKSFDT
ncbi:Flavonol sulfotransferase-like [Linum perenne]